MKRLCIMMCAVLVFAGAHAQTADEVIKKHLDATGGADKWPSVNTLVIEAVAVTQNGQEITSKISKIQNKIVRREINMGMGTMKMVVTPESGWFASPRNGGNFEPMPQGMLAELSLELDINPLSDYAAKGSKVEFVGKEQVDGKDAFKIKLTTSKGKERNYFIDAASYYLVKETFMSNRGGQRGGNSGGGTPPAGPTEVTVTFDNFQKTPEGFVFPFTISTSGMGAKQNLEKIEVNPAVDEASLMEGIKK